ncbi:MAG: guanylate kinase [Clostridia bacterium]|nr:guanylate kinase [Clostridia bacterium]
MQSKILIVCAPSGGGKGTIVRLLRRHYGDWLWESISCTSRQPRGDEQDGKEYYFISQEEFDRLMKTGYLAEYNHFGNGKSYGTPADKLDSHLEQGCMAVLDIDINGARQVIEKYYDKYPIVAVFLLPESLEELRRRLISRGTETVDQIDKRIATARLEYQRMLDTESRLFDAVILNAAGQQEETASEVIRIIESIDAKRATIYAPGDTDFPRRDDLFDIGEDNV